MNATQDESRFRILIPEDRLQARIQELGAQIRSDYGDRPIVCICVLKGSFMFTADLVRAIGGELEVEFLGVSSYQGGTKTTGVVKITKDLSSPIEDKDVTLSGGCFAKATTTACLYSSPLAASCSPVLMADLVPGDIVLGRDGALLQMRGVVAQLLRLRAD